MRLAAQVFGVGAMLALGGAPRSARAFEREWHLGGGVGFAAAKGLTLGPAVSAYAAYGLTDTFDARLEITGRGYEFRDDSAPHALSAMAGVAYKLDVLRWVPWAAV